MYFALADQLRTKITIAIRLGQRSDFGRTNSKKIPLITRKNFLF